MSADCLFSPACGGVWGMEGRACECSAAGVQNWPAGELQLRRAVGKFGRHFALTPRLSAPPYPPWNRGGSLHWCAPTAERKGGRWRGEVEPSLACR